MPVVRRLPPPSPTPTLLSLPLPPTRGVHSQPQKLRILMARMRRLPGCAQRLWRPHRPLPGELQRSPPIPGPPVRIPHITARCKITRVTRRYLLLRRRSSQSSPCSLFRLRLVLLGAESMVQLAPAGAADVQTDRRFEGPHCGVVALGAFRLLPPSISPIHASCTHTPPGEIHFLKKS